MAYTSGLATDYRDLLDKLDKFLTNRHVSAIAINAAGTGYVVGDILSVADGTVEGGMTAQIEVLEVGGSGEITSARIFNSGAYSVDPTTTGTGVTGGTGTGATFDLTMAATGWTNRIRNISSAVDPIVAGPVQNISSGSGYVVGDVVTLNTPFVKTSEATYRVDAVNVNGTPTLVSLVDGGSYRSFASGSRGTTGGTGTGLNITPTFRPTRDEYLWEGAGTGGDVVFIGARSGYEAGIDQRLWELAGFTGWNGSSDWEAQPGISPGRNDFTNLDGCALMLSQSATPFWFYATLRRIIIVANVGGNYQSAHLGLLDPYGTNTEIPYPMYICGMSDRFNESIGGAPMWMRGPADPTARFNSTTSPGPGVFRDGDGAWYKVSNGLFDGTDIGNNNTHDYFVYPCAKVKTSGLSPEDSFASIVGNFVWDRMIPPNKAGQPTARFMPSPDPVDGDIYWPIPCVVIRSKGTSTHRALGEINGLYWIMAESGVQTEDRIIAGNRYFRVFQMGVNSESYAHFCVEEV